MFKPCVGRSVDLSEFWLSEEQFGPLLPDEVRVDDRSTVLLVTSLRSFIAYRRKRIR